MKRGDRRCAQLILFLIELSGGRRFGIDSRRARINSAYSARVIGVARTAATMSAVVHYGVSAVAVAERERAVDVIGGLLSWAFDLASRVRPAHFADRHEAGNPFRHTEV